ncbi:MAG: D-cysteine desulfhydrase family protein [Ardenticatenia bacterium]|nr:MAG: D-cysteine desulfhydrase family protein [Ardenticatenia bacterium]
MRWPNVPRVELLAEPTPLMRLHRFTRAVAPEGPIIWMKRDDLTPLVMGGNKVRKLEFLLAEALAQGCDTVITLGAWQSNHACQTAAAARKLGLRAVLLLRGDPQAPRVGNLLLDTLLGAEIRLDPHPPRDWGERVKAELEAEGRRVYFIPYGGSNATGALGYAAAGVELAQQLAAHGIEPAEIVITSSSGGTQAGLLLAQAAGFFSAPILGVSVDERTPELTDKVISIARAAAVRYGLRTPAVEAVRVTDAYVGPGYARLTPGARYAIHLLAQTEGILTDPVYTGKALAGLVDMARSGRWKPGEHVVFWHTGGLPALFAYDVTDTNQV